MPRTALFVLFSLAAASQVLAERGALDPAFAKVPFDQWLAGGEPGQIRWTAHVSHPQLSNHQRLLAGVEIQLDGADLVTRRTGELVIFVQLSDGDDRRYQNHATIDLEKLEEGVKANYLTYTQSAFLLPGEYRVSLAIFDTATGEHGVKQEKLHVAPLKKDPLPDAWQNLPPVEFIPTLEPPDRWYLPMVGGRLHLPLETRRPVRIEVIVNLTPSDRASGLRRIQDRNLGNLIPALKVISQVDLRNASLHVALLDLSRRRVTFHQDDVRDLDWPGIRDSLAEADPGTIDLKSLQDRLHNAAFFVAEVSRRIGSPSPPRALIVLTSPVEFESGEDLQPIRLTPTPDCRVFYVRYHAEAVQPRILVQPNRGRRSRSNYPSSDLPRRPVAAAQIDQLEPTLKPLAPRLFDVDSPEQLRKTLAIVLAEISDM